MLKWGRWVIWGKAKEVGDAVTILDIIPTALNKFAFNIFCSAN